MRGPWNFEEPLCTEIGTELFFPDKAETQTVRMARSICSQCTHKIECAQWAVDNYEEFGVWGGTVPRQRQKMRTKGIKVA